MNSNHRPTPWRVGGKQRTSIWCANENLVVSSSGLLSSDDAAFIVRACNSHDALVAALEALLRLKQGEFCDDYPPVSNNARIALALAKE